MSKKIGDRTNHYSWESWERDEQYQVPAAKGLEVEALVADGVVFWA